MPLALPHTVLMSDELERQAQASRRTAEDYLLHGDPAHIGREDRILFYSTEESEEFE